MLMGCFGIWINVLWTNSWPQHFYKPVPEPHGPRPATPFPEPHTPWPATLVPKPHIPVPVTPVLRPVPPVLGALPPRSSPPIPGPLPPLSSLPVPHLPICGPRLRHPAPRFFAPRIPSTPRTPLQLPALRSLSGQTTPQLVSSGSHGSQSRPEINYDARQIPHLSVFLFGFWLNAYGLKPCSLCRLGHFGSVLRSIKISQPDFSRLNKMLN